MAAPREVKIDIINDDAIVTPKLKLHLVLGATQVLFAGFEVVSRIALDQGLGKTAFVFYRNCLATILLGIFGIVYERQNWRKLTVNEFFYIFFLGFLGVTINQLCYLVGLGLTSVMIASAIRNCIPILTFFMACLFKLEHVDLRQRHGVAKLAGACLGLVGSVILSIYKGPMVLDAKFSIFKVKDTKLSSDDAVQEHVLNFFTKKIHYRIVSWHLGVIFLFLSGSAFALFLILQSKFLEKFPAPVTFASISCLSSVIQLPIIGAAFEPQWSSWRHISLGEGLSIVYAGVIGSGVVSGFQSWALQKGGPVVVAAYQPLETLVSACLSYFFLRESLHLGTIIGGLTVILGLYLLVWGQKKEQQKIDREKRQNTLTIGRIFPSSSPIELHERVCSTRMAGPPSSRHPSRMHD